MAHLSKRLRIRLWSYGAITSTDRSETSFKKSYREWINRTQRIEWVHLADPRKAADERMFALAEIPFATSILNARWNFGSASSIEWSARNRHALYPALMTKGVKIGFCSPALGRVLSASEIGKSDGAQNSAEKFLDVKIKKTPLWQLATMSQCSSIDDLVLERFIIWQFDDTMTKRSNWKIGRGQ